MMRSAAGHGIGRVRLPRLAETTATCLAAVATIWSATFHERATAQTCTGYWNSTGYPYPSFGVGHLATFDDGTGTHLYAGGRTDIPGQPQPITVQRWDGHSWTPVILDVGGQCNQLVVLEDNQGKFLFASGLGGTQNIRWARILRPGSSWTPPPPGLFSGTLPLAGPSYCFDDGTGMAIYGVVSTQLEISTINKWTGTAWQPLGGTLISASYSGFTSLNEGDGPKLIVSGQFFHIGTVPVDRVARWTGSSWTSFPPLPNFGYTRTLDTFNDGTGEALYLGGDAVPSGTGLTSPILKWTGQAWAPLTTVPWYGYTSEQTQVSALHVFDDGRGPALFAAGFFSSAAGVPANGLARWDGHSWEAIPGGVGFQTLRMADYNDGRGPSLFLSGTFNTAGGGNSFGVAQWVGCPNCYNNCDASAAAPRLNVNDFMCFINAHARRDPYANCDLNNTINAADFICFMNKFATGCP